MAYSQFTLDMIEEQFNISQVRETLFHTVKPIPMSDWLNKRLTGGIQIAFISESEKARSEFIIAPILFEWQEHNQNFTLYSGRNFDVDAKRGLTGECDFIITLTPPMQTIHAPVITMLEAKKQNIEQHLGQCAAQMIGAKQFNEQKDKQEIDMIFGCVTTGEAWQFLKLRQNTLTIDSNRYYLNDVAVILGVLQIISENFGSPTT